CPFRAMVYFTNLPPSSFALWTKVRSRLKGRWPMLARAYPQAVMAVFAPRNVPAIVKQGAARLRFHPSTFGGHSLRAGFVTSAVKRGANLIKITDVTGHRSLEMLKTYSRDAEAFVGYARRGTALKTCGRVWTGLAGLVGKAGCRKKRTFFICRRAGIIATGMNE